VATGLSWTSLGTGRLLFIEATQYPGKGRLLLTGKLGDVIRESATIALSWVRSNAHRLTIPPDTGLALVGNGIDVHVHFPAGAVPKDGPSAGVAIAVAIVSMLLRQPCRSDVAMTGEISLRGNVLPVGGIKEKVLAAHRAGIKIIVLPRRNERDVLADIPAAILRDLQFVYANHIDQVLPRVFDQEVLVARPVSPALESRL
jgi:ATP-dependent Lon protease